MRHMVQRELEKGAKLTHLCEEFMAQYVVQVRSVLWGLGQEAGDELFGLGRQGGGQGVTRLPNTSVRLFQIGGLKRGSAQEHGIPAEQRSGRDLVRDWLSLQCIYIENVIFQSLLLTRNV